MNVYFSLINCYPLIFCCCRPRFRHRHRHSVTTDTCWPRRLRRFTSDSRTRCDRRRHLTFENDDDGDSYYDGYYDACGGDCWHARRRADIDVDAFTATDCARSPASGEGQKPAGCCC